MERHEGWLPVEDTTPWPTEPRLLPFVPKDIEYEEDVWDDWVLDSMTKSESLFGPVDFRNPNFYPLIDIGKMEQSIVNPLYLTYLTFERLQNDYALQLIIYDDWRYLHFISIEKETDKPRRDKDACICSPMKELEKYEINEHTPDAIKLLTLITTLIRTQNIKPVKFQPYSKKTRLVLSFRSQKLGLFVKWLFDQKHLKSDSWINLSDVNISKTFNQFIPVVDLTQEQQNRLTADLNDLMCLLSHS